MLGTNAQHLNLWCWFSTPMLLFAPFCFSTFNPFHSVHRNACPLCHVAVFVHNAAWRKRFGRCVALYPLAIKLELSALIAFSRFSQCFFLKKIFNPPVAYFPPQATAMYLPINVSGYKNVAVDMLKIQSKWEKHQEGVLQAQKGDVLSLSQGLLSNNSKTLM